MNLKNLRSNSVTCVKFPICTGTAYELRFKPSHSEWSIPRSETYTGCDIDDGESIRMFS